MGEFNFHGLILFHGAPAPLSQQPFADRYFVLVIVDCVHDLRQHLTEFLTLLLIHGALELNFLFARTFFSADAYVLVLVALVDLGQVTLKYLIIEPFHFK